MARVSSCRPPRWPLSRDGAALMAMGAPWPCLRSPATATILGHVSRVAWAMLGMPGRLTMRGLARWAGRFRPDGLAYAPRVDDDRAVPKRVARPGRPTARGPGRLPARHPYRGPHCGAPGVGHGPWGLPLQAAVRQRDPDARILDWTAACRGETAGEETLHRRPETPEPIDAASFAARSPAGAVCMPLNYRQCFVIGEGIAT